MLFFQFMIRRYEDASTVLVSTEGFEEGVKVSETRPWGSRLHASTLML